MTKNNDKDVRVAGGLQVRNDGDGERRMIVGYAAVFGQRTDIGWFEEQIERGAFTEALKDSDVHALYNHDFNQLPLGRAKAGTLRMSEDDKGLRVEIDLPDTQFARDLEVSMERGDVDQMSFAFSMRGGVDEWDETGETPVRTIKRVGELYDVTVCPRGAYPQTECALRSYEAHKAKRNYTNTKLRIKMKQNYLRAGENGSKQ